MKKLLGVLIAGVLLASAALAYAEDPNGVYLMQPGYGGNGCPQGTVNATLSPDSKQLSILFDSYMAEANYDRKTDRKSCNLTIPVHVPQGWSVSVFKTDYRGFTSIPYGALGRFSVEYFWAGIKGPSYTKTFTGGTNGDYYLTNTLQASAFVWSACGADVNLRVNTSMLAQSNSRGEQTLATLDSVDIDSGLVYALQWRRCN